MSYFIMELSCAHCIYFTGQFGFEGRPTEERDGHDKRIQFPTRLNHFPGEFHCENFRNSTFIKECQWCVCRGRALKIALKGVSNFSEPWTKQAQGCFFILMKNISSWLTRSFPSGQIPCIRLPLLSFAGTVISSLTESASPLSPFSAGCISYSRSPRFLYYHKHTRKTDAAFEAGLNMVTFRMNGNALTFLFGSLIRSVGRSRTLHSLIKALGKKTTM